MLGHFFPTYLDGGCALENFSEHFLPFLATIFIFVPVNLRGQSEILYSRTVVVHHFFILNLLQTLCRVILPLNLNKDNYFCEQDARDQPKNGGNQSGPGQQRNHNYCSMYHNININPNNNSEQHNYQHNHRVNSS
jgi:hypothetical protein